MMNMDNLRIMAWNSQGVNSILLGDFNARTGTNADYCHSQSITEMSDPSTSKNFSTLEMLCREGRNNEDSTINN